MGHPSVPGRNCTRIRRAFSIRTWHRRIPSSSITHIPDHENVFRILRGGAAEINEQTTCAIGLD
jgi:hypothetical protein